MVSFKCRQSRGNSQLPKITYKFYKHKKLQTFPCRKRRRDYFIVERDFYFEESEIFLITITKPMTNVKFFVFLFRVTTLRINFSLST